MTTLRTLSWLAALLLVVGACRRGPATRAGPEGAFGAFTDALRKQDVKAAFGLLSEKSRSRLEANSKALAEQSGGAIRDDAALLAFRTPHVPNPLVSIKALSQDDSKATLEVHSCQKPLDATGACPANADVQETVQMVKEGQRWVVELPEVMP